MIQRCGKSGVELHEIRRNVNADGEDTTSKGKPNNGYTDGRKGTKVRGFNANRPRSCGFGPSKLHLDESMPKLSATQQSLLISIDEGRTSTLPKNNTLALTLVTKGLIGWSDNRQQYATMADGRRVVGLLQIK